MKKLLARLIWLPLGLLLVVFLVANRAPVAVSLDPFNTENPAIASPAIPLWVWLILMLLAGYFLGAATAWVSARGGRKQAKADRKELKTLRKDKQTQEAAGAAADGENLPVLKAS